MKCRPFRDALPHARPIDRNRLVRAGTIAAGVSGDPRAIRLEAVLLGCAAMHLQQTAEAHRHPTPHQLLDPAELARGRHLLEAAICELAQHLPQVFPAELGLPDWPDDALGHLFHGLWQVDLIGGRDVRGDHECDIISELFGHTASMAGKQNQYAAFHTPHRVARAMVMAIDPVGDDRMLEPAIGSGAMAVAAWYDVARAIRTAADNGQLDDVGQLTAVARWASNFVGVDLDVDAAWTARANLSVRTGWPVTVLHGDSLAPLDTLPAASWPLPLTRAA